MTVNERIAALVKGTGIHVRPRYAMEYQGVIWSVFTEIDGELYNIAFLQKDSQPCEDDWVETHIKPCVTQLQTLQEAGGDLSLPAYDMFGYKV